MKIILVRHTQTDLNVAKRYSGQLDPPLNDAGVKQAQSLRDKLEGEEITLAFSSDLIRAKQTARIILSGRNVELSTSPLLREGDVGVTAGMTRQEALDRFGDERINTRHPHFDFSLVGGESSIEVVKRYHTFFREFSVALALRLTPNPHKTALVVCHGTALRFFLEEHGLSTHEQGDFTIADLDQLLITVPTALQG